MKVQVEIAVNGQVYLTKKEELPINMTLKGVADILYDNIAKANSYQSPLEDGGFLVLGGDALHSAAFKFNEVSETF